MAIPAPARTDEDIRQQVVNELRWAAERAVLRTDLDIAAAAGESPTSSRYGRTARRCPTT
jgi:hypothetical protein